MTPTSTTNVERTARATGARRLLLGSAAALVSLLALAPLAGAACPSGCGDDAVVTVVFHADDLGFNATSTKDISNIIVEDCAGVRHKHDGLDGTLFEHRETFVVAAVFVKSGNNGIDGNDPPGAGERFVNEGACQTSTTTAPPTTSAPPTTTADSSTTGNSTEVPFFTSGAAIALGLGGALVATLAILRRRL